MANAPPTEPQTPAAMHCPLCERVIKKLHKCKQLNGVIVCPKCRNGFANRRQGAYVLDMIIWQLAAVLPLYYFGLMPEFAPIGFQVPPTAVDDFVIVFFSWVFPMTFYLKDGFGGMSPGKAICGVQVIDISTREPIGFGRSFKRNLCLIVPFSALIIAVMMMKGRRWGDGWAKTQVVWKKYAFRLPFNQGAVLCLNCGYDLTGNTSGRCPECFTPIVLPATPVAASESA